MTTYKQKLDTIDPDVVTKLEEIFNDVLPNVEKHLNAGIIAAQSSEGCWLIPKTDVTPGKPTTPENPDEAFILNPAGTVTLEYIKVPFNTVIIRYILDYEVAIAASKSKNAFEVIVGPVVKDMIDELRSVKGFNEFGFSYGDVYGSFKRPGSEGRFYNNEGSGIELRLYSNASRLDAKKEVELKREKFLKDTTKEGLKSV